MPKKRQLLEKRSRYENNKMSLNKQKSFFAKLKNENRSKIKNPPSKEQIEIFWKSILSSLSYHNQNTPWLQQEKQNNNNITQDKWENITPEIFHTNMKKPMNWKSPGTDKVHNFWLKKLISLHTPLLHALNKIYNNPKKCQHGSHIEVLHS